jgi:23S rRNA U2552 (ribose-2'-O)-methylase RlmE/FtsJ
MGIPLSADLSRFDFDQSKDISAHIKETLGYDGEMLQLFAGNKGKVVHKWHHYIPLYEKYFSNFRNRKIRFLEIGVSKGGSLQMWRKYFGRDAIIFGIDINPECEKYNGLAGQVRIGSQSDAKFLHSVVAEMGGVDIVLDDGSHRMDHIVASLRVLFPQLNNSGIYLIEDLHTAYFSEYRGGIANKTNFFNKIRDVIDDMHHWYHEKDLKEISISGSCSAIHIHDSIVVLEKNKIYRPVHSQIS